MEYGYARVSTKEQNELRQLIALREDVYKRQAGYRRHVGRGRSGDISCRKKDVSFRRPRKARKICYTEHRKLKNCPGAPPDP